MNILILIKVYNNVKAGVNLSKEVYIVHCIDTEGPLYEPLEATFDRINDIFGIKLDPTNENLCKLQNKQLNLNGNEQAVSELLDSNLISTLGTWDQIDQMLNKTMNLQFRNQLLDSNGQGWIYNWFCIDHVGFTGYNPRRRDAGYHNIYDHYCKIVQKDKLNRDIIQWHYHPVPINGDYNASGITYISSKNVFDILARKIIDRMFFPAVFRPGFHTERPDSNWFLEQWIPFDYANQAVKGIDTNQPDLSEGRFGDWRRAPKEWVVYHPSHDDYQTEGNSRRWIARCLNMHTRLREITIDDFRDGFKRANSGKSTLISFTDHDFRDIRFDVNRMREMIKVVSKEYPDVKFYFADAVTAMRKVLNLKEKKPELRIDVDKKKSKLCVESFNGIFGPQPFLALKTVTGTYYWDNFDFQGKNQWSYTFDFNTLNFNSIEKIGIAANSLDGTTEVIVYDCLNDNTKFKRYNY